MGGMGSPSDKKPSGPQRMEMRPHRDPHSGEMRAQPHRVGSNKAADERAAPVGQRSQLLRLASLGDDAGMDQQTPVEVDTALAKLYNEQMGVLSRIEREEGTLHNLAGDRRRVVSSGRQRGTYEWGMTLDEVMEKGPRSSFDESAWASTIEERNSHFERLDEIAAEEQALNQKFLDAGGWPRFFLVQQPGGHIHSSTGCSTCYPTTRFGWLPELSGQSEAEAVENYGGILCSVCYPSAPSEWTEGISKQDAEAKAAREEAKRERDAAKLAKALMPDGKPLRLPDSRDTLKTQRSAEIWLSDSFDDFYKMNDKRHANDRELVLAALEEKTGKSRDELMAETWKRVKARRKREGRA
jgi:hypothetical protein